MGSSVESSPYKVKIAARAAQMTPLEYMLAVMNDDGVDPIRRDRMAMAAAPYTHPRAEQPASAGKKDQAAEAAKTAGQGSGWGDDLTGQIAALN